MGGVGWVGANSSSKAFGISFADRPKAKMMEDLLRHIDAIQASKFPLILKDDVPLLRLIANKRMTYLTETYRNFKDTVSKN
jgi:hypothetical protein